MNIEVLHEDLPSQTHALAELMPEPSRCPVRIFAKDSPQLRHLAGCRNGILPGLHEELEHAKCGEDAKALS